MAISFLGILLILSALFCFYKALDLIPTDLGLSWFQGGFTLISAGIIVLAMAFAVRALRARAPVMAGDSASVVAPPVSPETDVVPVAEASSAGRIGAALAVGAAAGAVAGAMHVGSKDETGAVQTAASTIPDDKILEDLERDLFDERPVPEVTEIVAPAIGPATRISIPTFDIEYTPIGPASIADPVALESGADTPEPDAAIVEPVAEIEEAAPLQEPAAFLEPGSESGVEDEPAPPATPGLIADHDLAELADDWAPLAPLETLDVVGSYDSGGTRFTMYSDGSVVALSADSEKRYPSLDALRATIDARSSERTG